MISFSLIKKWKKMFTHDSVFHVVQSEGKFYSADKVEGYYNDLREKVLHTENLDKDGVPFNTAARGSEKRTVYFAITIFQYGLGAYDLYLEKKEAAYREKMLRMADWAAKHQRSDGSWDAFGVLDYHCAVSSMAQGEGASLLARAYVETNDEKYRASLIKAVDFMLKPMDEGGTARYSPEGIALFEYPEKPLVLNGWIFSAFGILDCLKITGAKKYRAAWESAIRCMKGKIKAFDAGHWSYYDLGKKFTSPFYHALHIELLKALNRLSPDPVFDRYIQKWTKHMNGRFWRTVAFARKAKQKVFEKQSHEWVLVG